MQPGSPGIAVNHLLLSATPVLGEKKKLMACVKVPDEMHYNCTIVQLWQHVRVTVTFEWWWTFSPTFVAPAST